MPRHCNGMPKFSHWTMGTWGEKSDLGHVQITAWAGRKVVLVLLILSHPCSRCLSAVLL